MIFKKYGEYPTGLRRLAYRRKFIKDKAQAIAQAVINMTSGILKAQSDGFGFLTPMIYEMGMTQIKLIRLQPMDKPRGKIFKIKQNKKRRFDIFRFFRQRKSNLIQFNEKQIGQIKTIDELQRAL